jgi:hypothetical protein
MINFSLRFLVLVCIVSFMPAYAEYMEYLYPGALFTKNDRAFSVKYESEKNTYSLQVYSFPDLVEIKRIDLPSNYTYSTLHDLGILVYSMDYVDEKMDDSSNPNLWATTVTTNLASYDLNLSSKGNLKMSDVYTYELYDPLYLDLKEVKNKKKNKSQCVFKKLKNGKLSLVH